jgi:ethanolaminephosphotransferase
MHLPDIGKFLSDPENVDWLFSAVVFGLVGILVIIALCPESNFFKWTTAASLFSVYGFHARKAALPFESIFTQRGLIEARIVFAAICVGLVGGFADYVVKKREKHGSETASVSLWRRLRLYLVVFAALTGKTHNIPLLAVSCATQELYFRLVLVDPTFPEFAGIVPSPSNMLSYWVGAFVMAMAGFYAQGNSNSLSTIHLASGYVGLESHSVVLTGPLLILSTYSHFLIWLLRAGEGIFEVSNSLDFEYPIYDSSRSVLMERFKGAFGLGILWAKGVPFAFYLVFVYILREHLFIWSVFAPKLLYEGMTTFVCVLASVLISM